jgi:thiol-disulfide isomerase/thioredoxin
MRSLKLRSLALPALVGGVIVLVGWLTAGRAADRPADQIIADLDANPIPRLDPGEKGNIAAMTAFMTKRRAALARRGELTFELLRGYPDHKRLPGLFAERWQNQLMQLSDSSRDVPSADAEGGPRKLDEATARAKAAMTAELDDVMSRAVDEKLRSETAFYRTVLEIQVSANGPDDALKAADEFVKIAPKDPQGALLLSTIADQMEGDPRQADLYRRIVAGYPDSTFIESARTSLKRLESVGKPFDLEFDDAITGAHISMKDLRGKAVVVYFWATWCAPCETELPILKETYARFHGRGVEFIGISLDKPKEEGGLAILKRYVARNGITWPQYHQGGDWTGPVSREWGITAIPAIFVVDREGKLASINGRGHLDEILADLLKKQTDNPPSP